MKNIAVVEAKSRFSALLVEVEAGEEIAVTRRGKVVARLVPDRPRNWHKHVSRHIQWSLVSSARSDLAG
ncbi:type II toxin-antitoxin system Phd/YefM family antitoxin [Mesorhizobium onobrychidis]|uniref:Antitoxin n=1 Tax=Mesorhizobium onobrychidis TaxID=2775404 RepID=A0ABY5QYI2_9HYPH|nr:type II toxin-antitoxin system prevent-host-death family antitoxin [Mesorhizobium onobrychidis]UVC15512.1 type II toxin-antitoxin system prevent-host-death family antitoxin [Mesorhizobium onobrychidis]